MDFSALTKAGKQIVEQYKQMIEDQIETATTAVAKLTALKDLGTENPFADSSGLMDDLGTAMDLAVSVCDALVENPLVAVMLDKLKNEYGFDFGSPLNLVKSLLGQEANNLVSVAMAMVKFPIVSEKYLFYVDQELGAARLLLLTLDSEGVDLTNSDRLADSQTIPPEVILGCKRAKNLLQSSLGTNFNEPSYAASIETIVETLEVMGNIKMWGDSLAAGAFDMAAKLVFDQLKNQITEIAKTTRKARLDVENTISVIKNTDVNNSSRSAVYARARKAKVELDTLIRQMSNHIPAHITQVPGYIITLTAIKKALEISKPTQTEPPAAFPNQSMIWNAGAISNMDRSIARLYAFTKRPSRIDMLAAHLTEAEANKDALRIEFYNVTVQIDAMWAMIPGIKDLVNMAKGYCADAGLDNAVQAIGNGNLDALMSMNPLTATGLGSTIAALETVDSFLKAYNICDIDDEIFKLKQKLKKKLGTKETTNEAKKNQKIAKIKKTIAEAAQGIDELIDVTTKIAAVGESIGMIIRLNT